MRLFVAIDIPEGLKGSLRAFQEEHADLPVRYARPEQIHLTLKFLGEVPEGKVHKVAEALAGVEFSPFSLQSGKVGSFSHVLIWEKLPA